MDVKETTNTTTTTSSAPTIASLGNSNSRYSENGPLDQFQITRHLLYERDFGGDAYVSAHLQRLQNGCFIDENIHEEDKLLVTFAAVTFTFHPSLSEEHRFRSAVITITASSPLNGTPIKFLKFAPHLAFGRISSASLKWYFQLAATVGVTKGLSEASLKPSMGYEKNVVLGAMVRIQGSTRSTIPHEPFMSISPSRSPSKPRKKLPDTRLVWSLEENPQQESGLPREFTFVFLMERTRLNQKAPLKEAPVGSTDGSSFRIPTSRQRSTSTKTAKECEQMPNTLLGMGRRALALTAPRTADLASEEEHIEYFNSVSTSDLQLESEQYTPIVGSPRETLDGIRETIARIPRVRLRSSEEETPVYFEKLKSRAKALESEEVFTPIHFSIAIQPQINGTLESKIFAYDSQQSIVSGEVGQKFPTTFSGDSSATDQHQNSLVNRLYNFAKLPGSFEDLVGLPGSSFSAVEPTL